MSKSWSADLPGRHSGGRKLRLGQGGRLGEEQICAEFAKGGRAGPARQQVGLCCYSNSAPLTVGGKIIVGARARDGQRAGLQKTMFTMPSIDLFQPWAFGFAGRRRLLRTLTIDRLVAVKAADRRAKSAAAASTNALARIGEGKVMSVVPSWSGWRERRAGLANVRAASVDMVARLSRLAEMTKM